MREYETLLVSAAEGVVVCTFHRPKARNALDAEMVREIRHLLAELSTDPEKWDRMNAFLERRQPSRKGPDGTTTR